MNLDSYTVRTRLYPSLLTGLPLGLATAAWFRENFFAWGTVWAMLVYCGLTMFLSQLGRDLGKRKEKTLFEKWGGVPTTLKLRHSGPTNAVTLSRYHRKLESLVPGVRIPSMEQEGADIVSADRVYQSCVDFLREKTRDRKRFGIVFEENVSYGFRRNLWGLKPIGVIISVTATFLIGWKIVLEWAFWVSAITYVLLIVNLFLLGCWILIVREMWIKLTADAYADRLLSSCETLL